MKLTEQQIAIINKHFALGWSDYDYVEAVTVQYNEADNSVTTFVASSRPLAMDEDSMMLSEAVECWQYVAREDDSFHKMGDYYEPILSKDLKEPKNLGWAYQKGKTAA